MNAGPSSFCGSMVMIVFHLHRPMDILSLFCLFICSCNLLLKKLKIMLKVIGFNDLIWWGIHRLRITVRTANLQHYIGAEMFMKARGIGVVVTVTWFFFRWKESLKNKLISNNKVDKVISLSLSHAIPYSLLPT